MSSTEPKKVIVEYINVSTGFFLFTIIFINVTVKGIKAINNSTPNTTSIIKLIKAADANRPIKVYFNPCLTPNIINNKGYKKIINWK